jgi:hypothetical protein
MTDKAKKRRRETAERLGVSRRAAADIIAKKTAAVRAGKSACSRCNGTGADPEVRGCTCDCCGGSGFEG